MSVANGRGLIDATAGLHFELIEVLSRCLLAVRAAIGWVKGALGMIGVSLDSFGRSGTGPRVNVGQRRSTQVMGFNEPQKSSKVAVAPLGINAMGCSALLEMFG